MRGNPLRSKSNDCPEYHMNRRKDVHMMYMEESSMSKDQSQALSQIIENITGDRIHEKKGGKFFSRYI